MQVEILPVKIVLTFHQITCHKRQMIQIKKIEVLIQQQIMKINILLCQK